MSTISQIFVAFSEKLNFIIQRNEAKGVGVFQTWSKLQISQRKLDEKK